MEEKSVVDEVFERVARAVLCEELGLSKQTMSDWKRWGYIPAKHAAKVESLTGIPRARLCPQFEWDAANDEQKARA